MQYQERIAVMKPVFRRILTGVAALLLVVGLSACALNDLINSPAAQGEVALDGFVRALRVEEFATASNFLVPANRQAFLETFDRLEKDLTVTDVRVEQIAVSQEGRRAEVSLELEYYLLPSAAVKTFRFDHAWIYFDGGKKEPSYYLIETPFPPFP